MAYIVYTLMCVSILSMCCKAQQEMAWNVGTPLDDEYAEAQSPAAGALENRLDAIETAIDVDHELFRNLTESLSRDFEMMQGRMKEVEVKLTELDANCTCKAEVPIPKVYRDCKAWSEAGYNTSGVYKIHPDGENETEVYCAYSTCGYGGGWTVFQRRLNSSVNFYRNWANYSQGFGNIAGQFWLGLELLHRLTTNDTELLVEMEDHGEIACAHHSNFSVGDLTSKYTLTISGFTNGWNSPGDALAHQNGMGFGTFDHVNGQFSSLNCAAQHQSGWWYKGCGLSDLNAPYNGMYVHWMSSPRVVTASKMMIK